ncbi:MAG: DoxX family protein [Phycisphaerales bacterium]|nr:DoxX family protein [Phycisphaerales bacterium]
MNTPTKAEIDQDGHVGTHSDDPLDSLIRSASPVLLVVGRVLIASLFLQSAISKTLHWDAALAEIASYGLPGGALTLAPSLGVQFFGGLGLIVGWKFRWCAAILIAFLLPATFYIHGFYRYEGEAFDHHLLGFFQNLTMMGGLVFALVTGPGPLSIDGARAFRRGRVP